MKDIRWFAQIDKKEVAKSFGVPENTIIKWKKAQTEGDNYRGYMYDKMSLIAKMEKDTEQKLKKLFTAKELMALWGAFAKSTMYSYDMIEMKNALEYGFSDYCAYEGMEASQFTDDLQTLKENVCKKLSSLCDFEKYVFLMMLKQK